MSSEPASVRRGTGERRGKRDRAPAQDPPDPDDDEGGGPAPNAATRRSSRAAKPSEKRADAAEQAEEARLDRARCPPRQRGRRPAVTDGGDDDDDADDDAAAAVDDEDDPDDDEEAGEEPKEKKARRARNPEGNFWDTDWLNRTFEKGDPARYGQRPPPPNYRSSASKVSQWRKYGPLQQNEEWLKWSKLSTKEKAAHSKVVPGTKESKTKTKGKTKTKTKPKKKKKKTTRPTRSNPKRGDAATSINHNSRMHSPGRRDAPQDAVDVDDEMDRRQEKGKKKKKVRRKQGSRPVDQHDVRDGEVLAAEDQLLNKAAKMIYMTNPDPTASGPSLPDMVSIKGAEVTVMVRYPVKEAPAEGGTASDPRVAAGGYDNVIVTTSSEALRESIVSASQLFKSDPKDTFLDRFDVIMDGDEAGAATMRGCALNGRSEDDGSGSSEGDGADDSGSSSEGSGGDSDDGKRQRVTVHEGGDALEALRSFIEGRRTRRAAPKSNGVNRDARAKAGVGVSSASPAINRNANP